MEKHNYKYLFFDLDNTLMNFTTASKAAFDQLVLDHQIFEAPDAYDVYKKINGAIWKAFEENKLNTQQIREMRFTQMLEHYNLQGDGLELNRIYLENLIRFPHLLDNAIECLDGLKRFYKLVLITNGLKEVQRPRLKAAGLYNYFEAIVVSDEIGVSKPDKRYFDYSFSLIEKVERKDVLVIGDNLNSDILGAENYGLDHCWFNGKHLENTSTLKPKFEVRSLIELKNLLLKN